MRVYRDTHTGYEICQYTEDMARNAKLYFTTENFSVDDQYFFFNKTPVDSSERSDTLYGLYRVHVKTGEMVCLADGSYTGFAMHWSENYGVILREDGMIMRIDIETGLMGELGRLPKGAVLAGHLTVANDGRVACGLKLQNKVHALAVLDPGETEIQLVYLTDQWIGHVQICPTDSNLIFYVHETGGDALQRTWMYDVQYRMARPYYVEHPNEWITHETWAADGSMMALMWIPGKIILGDKDGRHFDTVFETDKRILHPGISRDKRWLCTDLMWIDEADDSHASVLLVNPQNGQARMLAELNMFATGEDHIHPSFNRAGDKILFSSPDERGIAQICMIDLTQVDRP